jgi:N-methylhydantoinase A/oxoprolinase/acetone carboxylase beta subunit
MSAAEAYRRSGFESKVENCRQNAFQLITKSYIREAIDEKLNEFTKSVADKIKQSTDEAFEKQLSLMRSADNEFVQLNASKDILDRGGLKPGDNVRVVADVTNKNIDIDNKPKTQAEIDTIIRTIRELKKA